MTAIRQFYSTTLSDCPYLENRQEQRIVTTLSPDGDETFFDQMTRAGFRRSQKYLYRPACPGCDACIPVRVPVKDFEWTRPWRKLINRNNDITGEERPAEATVEQFDLFRKYLQARHEEGGMAGMAFSDYRDMVENGPSTSMVVEFRNDANELVAVGLTDRLLSGLSGVYKYFATEEPRRSLGTFVILWHIHRAQELGLDYFYLGYWIENCRKMAYKTRFKPMQQLGRQGWLPVEG